MPPPACRWPAAALAMSLPDWGEHGAGYAQAMSYLSQAQAQAQVPGGMIGLRIGTSELVRRGVEPKHDGA
ncbi:hypothetical protein [Leisingera sp. NJS204]|uniref:hypothetical protein n=1 Tax=Leisingera sp. NJS204 TaxID=2508307 RepID=UPI001010C8B1|nr:hypothetical protein [Leisingera sp. NJS204]QAX28503.1 hypothetical protein ETW24_03435 [Leisingera sp. NJS204]